MITIQTEAICWCMSVTRRSDRRATFKGVVVGKHNERLVSRIGDIWVASYRLGIG